VVGGQKYDGWVSRSACKARSLAWVCSESVRGVGVLSVCLSLSLSLSVSLCLSLVYVAFTCLYANEHIPMVVILPIVDPRLEGPAG
jgi:hypothetical protein